MQQCGHVLVANGCIEAERVSEPMRRGHDEARRMDEGIELEQIEPRQVRITEAGRHQRRVEDEQRRIAGGEDRLALADAARVRVTGA